MNDAKIRAHIPTLIAMQFSASKWGQDSTKRIKNQFRYFTSNPMVSPSAEISPAKLRGDTVDEIPVINPLEQFVLLAQTVKGPELLEIITQAIETPGVHVFGELLDLPNIKELENGPDHVYWNTLNLFAFGTFREYLVNEDKYLELTPAQTQKLQLLTIVTMATKTKYIPYYILLEELAVDTVREVEDLIIEAIYADLIQGKMDQKNWQFEVDDIGLGRDVKPTDIKAATEIFTTWGQNCETLMAFIQQQINRAEKEKQEANERKEKVLQDFANIMEADPDQAEEEGL